MGGYWALELDLLVANEIGDQLNASVQDKKSSKRNNAKSVIARRNQRRETFSNAETAKQLTELMGNKEN